MTQVTSQSITDGKLLEILEKLSDKSNINKENHSNLNKLNEKFVLKKFDNKTTNAKQWLQSFESECTRFNLNGDTERISALRLFLNDSENDWYGSMLIQHGLDSLWKIWKEHLKHLSKLLDAIAEEGFRLKLTKCKFAAQSVRFLGHIVEGNTITPLKDNLRSIAEFPAPQNKKQIRQFLDHKPLENLNIKNRTDDELGDMTHYLSQYNFVIKYNPGKSNTEADCLSRNPVYESHENEEDKLKTVNIVRIEEILEDQNRNPTLKNKHSFIKENGPAEKPFQIMSIDTVGGFGGNRSSKDQVIKDNEVEILLSDQYPALNSKEFKKYLKDHSVNLIFTAVDSPFSNGINERLNQTLFQIVVERQSRPVKSEYDKRFEEISDGLTRRDAQKRTCLTQRHGPWVETGLSLGGAAPQAAVRGRVVVASVTLIAGRQFVLFNDVSALNTRGRYFKGILSHLRMATNEIELWFQL
ncbi:hypothetical protein EVAR_10070_1 [Eumeta japonica]|uniref:Integrase catalytic domain-containing protein n=1 Tax=Eumeta variegata TaxID=151549 RepID=A0A4C1TR92_EUMVA|nr:hypothetical protein EVAR_10070_1 [Eumeta japonica]